MQGSEQTNMAKPNNFSLNKKIIDWDAWNFCIKNSDLVNLHINKNLRTLRPFKLTSKTPAQKYLCLTNEERTDTKPANDGGSMWCDFGRR